MEDFESLVQAASAAPTAGWDFSFLEGRATEERPGWGYARIVRDRIFASNSVLDVQTGGGELLAEVPTGARTLVATESWLPNVSVARHNLRLSRSHVVAVDNASLPFRIGTFDLVISRHPVITPWDDIARVLVPGGTYLSQQVGAGSNWELIEFLMGPQLIGAERSVASHRDRARAAGLDIVDLREATLKVEFFDIGAVVYFLRKVIWTVPDFGIGRYRSKLQDLHESICRSGSFVCHSKRFLIEARLPL